MYNIYMFINELNGKGYIGQTTKTIAKRFGSHCGTARRGSTTYFHKALRKYGTSKWQHLLLDTCSSQNYANILEIYYIKRHATQLLGYNLTEGGEGCNNFSNKTMDEMDKFKEKIKLIHYNRSKKEKKAIADKISETKQSFTNNQKQAVSSNIKNSLQAMTEEQKELKIQRYKDTMSEADNEQKRRRKIAEAWMKKDMNEYSKKIKNSLQAMTEEQKELKIQRYKDTMRTKSQQEINTMKEKISKSGSKKWEIISPTNEKYIISGLRKFCLDNKLPLHKMYNIAAGHIPKGDFKWKCRKID